MPWQRGSMGQEGGKALSAPSSRFPGVGISLDACHREKPLVGAEGWSLEIVHSVYLQANPSSSAWPFLCGFIPSPSTTGAVTSQITLVSSSLTSPD